MRKIIQVSMTGCENNQVTQASFVTTALCDDGTVWQLFGFDDRWFKMPNVPQDQTSTQGSAEVKP